REGGEIRYNFNEGISIYLFVSMNMVYLVFCVEIVLAEANILVPKWHAWEVRRLSNIGQGR
ncbi:hypothetical protein OFM39_33175, partial [Escherichia coli]|nr:hypothetical protein [Escherichia coli]